MSNRRKLLFIVLVLGTLVLMLVSWLTPWWLCTVDAVYMLNQGLITIRPWGLEHNLGSFSGYVTGAELPVWFAPMMWGYLGVSIVVLLVALLMRDRVIRFRGRTFNLPAVLIGLVGIAYIICAITAAVFAATRTADFGISFLGKSTVIVDPHAGGSADLTASLQWGYWLAYVVGIVLLVLAAFRDRILGQAKAST